MWKRIAALTFLALVFGACSGSTSAGVDTTKPPQTVTSNQSNTTTTRQQLVDGGLITIDPATLIPISGSDPVVVGISHQGVVSPNGQFTVIETWNKAGTGVTISIVDNTSTSVLSSVVAGTGVQGLTIDDQGTAFWLDHLYNSMPINVLSAETQDPFRLTLKLPEGFFSDELAVLDDQRLGLFGSYPEGGVVSGDVSVMVVDITSQSVQEIKLPTIKTGIIGEVESSFSFPVFEIMEPAVVWDSDNERALVVEATRDVVTEIDLNTGAVTEHTWEIPEAFLTSLFMWLTPPAQAKGPSVGTRRDAILSPDGRSLYVATAVSTLEETASKAVPQNLIAIDTETWQIAGVFEATADTLYASPDGVHLFAQGAVVTESGTEFQTRATPVYMIDMNDREFVVGYEIAEESRAELDFSANGDMVYISTWGDQGRKIDVLDLGLGQLTGSITFRQISLVGRAGLMAFHFEE